MKLPRNFFISILVAGALLQGCTYPQSQVRRGENRPGVVVEGAPEGAVLVIDGIEHGEARLYDGKPATLLIEPGAHSVTVRQGGRVLLQRDIYVDAGETRVLTLQRK